MLEDSLKDEDTERMFNQLKSYIREESWENFLLESL